MVAGANEADLQRMWEYGLHVGVLRQITDDVQDFWGGKQLGGNSTPHTNLPICYTAWVLQGQERDAFMAVLEKAMKADLACLKQIREMVEVRGAREFVTIVARGQLDQAVTALRRTTRSQESLVPLCNLLEVMLPWLPSLASQDPSSIA